MAPLPIFETAVTPQALSRKASAGMLPVNPPPFSARRFSVTYFPFLVNFNFAHNFTFQIHMQDFSQSQQINSHIGKFFA